MQKGQLRGGVNLWIGKGTTGENIAAVCQQAGLVILVKICYSTSLHWRF